MWVCEDVVEVCACWECGVVVVCVLCVCGWCTYSVLGIVVALGVTPLQMPNNI